MKVRAKLHGQYKGHLYEPGQQFVIEDGTYPVYEVDSMSRRVIKDGKPVVVENRSHLEYWMEEIQESKKKGLFS